MDSENPDNNRLSVALVRNLLGLLLFLFGSYLLYDKVHLALRTGHAHERAGIIERAADPLFFWMSVSVFGLFGSLITIAGLATLLYPLIARRDGNRE